MHQWWNRQTRTLEGRMGQPVQVQVLSGALIAQLKLSFLFNRRSFYVKDCDLLWWWIFF